MAENALVRLFGREAATRRRNALAEQFAPDSTPIRNRIADHRQQVDATLGGTTLQNRLAMIGGSGVPVLSDVAGLAADAMGYAGDPSSRTMGNYGLSALGLLPFLPGMTAYHGTPHRFAPEPDAPLGKFKMEKLGTGEGAQAYGHGMYFAESPDVGTRYRSMLAPEKRLTDLNQRIALVKVGDTPATAYDVDAMDELVDAARKGPEHTQKFLSDRLESWRGNAADESYPFHDYAIKKIANYERMIKDVSEKGIDYAGDGSLYHVDIPDEQIDQMLDWDKPLSEQPESVRKALNPASLGLQEVNYKGARGFADPVTQKAVGPLFKNVPEGMDLAQKWTDELMRGSGRDFYKRLGDDAVASRVLNSAGIPGIRYFDGGSRGAGQGTRNFVVFEPDKLKILARE